MLSDSRPVRPRALVAALKRRMPISGANVTAWPAAANSAERRFLSPPVQGRFTVRHSIKNVHIVQAKVGILSLPRAKTANPAEVSVSPI